MQYENLIVEQGRIARIILNRPDKRNALSKALMKEIREALLELDTDPEVAVIIISGAGKGFCAGGDLEALVAPDSIMDGRDMKSNIMHVLTTIGKIGKIVITQVHGFALAGGFGLAMTADLTVVSDDCQLGMPEIKRGLSPMNIMNPIARCMPRKPLLEMIFSGNNITPQQALQWDLVNRVVPAADLEAETLKLAESMACHSGAALKLSKNAFYNMQNMDYFTAFNYLTDLLTINALTEDAKEGVKAFFEKRKPQWINK